MRKSAVNKGMEHIAKNLSLFGFGTEESAIIQCVKELLEVIFSL
jgi:hypothetical protein